MNKLFMLRRLRTVCGRATAQITLFAISHRLLESARGLIP